MNVSIFNHLLVILFGAIVMVGSVMGGASGMSSVQKSSPASQLLKANNNNGGYGQSDLLQFYQSFRRQDDSLLRLFVADCERTATYRLIHGLVHLGPVPKPSRGRVLRLALAAAQRTTFTANFFMTNMAADLIRSLHPSQALSLHPSWIEIKAIVHGLIESTPDDLPMLDVGLAHFCLYPYSHSMSPFTILLQELVTVVNPPPALLAVFVAKHLELFHDQVLERLLKPYQPIQIADLLTAVIDRLCAGAIPDRLRARLDLKYEFLKKRLLKSTSLPIEQALLIESILVHILDPERLAHPQCGSMYAVMCGPLIDLSVDQAKPTGRPCLLSGVDLAIVLRALVRSHPYLFRASGSSPIRDLFVKHARLLSTDEVTSEILVLLLKIEDVDDALLKLVAYRVEPRYRFHLLREMNFLRWCSVFHQLNMDAVEVYGRDRYLNLVMVGVDTRPEIIRRLQSDQKAVGHWPPSTDMFADLDFGPWLERALSSHQSNQ